MPHALGLHLHVQTLPDRVCEPKAGAIVNGVIMCSSMQCIEPAFANVRISGGGGDKVVTCQPCKECLRKIRDAESLRPKHWPALTVSIKLI